MKKYIGTKFVKAEPCLAWKDMGGHKAGEEGYKVIYKDGYTSWSPKDVFEEAYCDASEMLVKKGDFVGKDDGDGTLIPFEVICADTSVFVTAPVKLKKDGKHTTTNYNHLAAYSNMSSINTLEELHFVKLDGELTHG